MALVSGMGMPLPSPPRSKFDYPEGGGRYCPACDQRMEESTYATEFHVYFKGRLGCHPLWVQAGWDADNDKPVVIWAKFIEP